MPVDPTDFRRVIGTFATGVSVVTAPGPHGMTVSALASLSLDPLLLLVCLEQGTPTLDAVVRHGWFGVTVLSEQQADMSDRFAFTEDPFAGLVHETGPSGVPLLPGGGLAQLLCQVWQRHPGGDHEIVIGEVIECDGHPGQPLVYWRSTYHRLAAEAGTAVGEGGGRE